MRAGARARDFAAVLLVIRGDFVRLRRAKTQTPQRRGLHQKLMGDLNQLPLQARRYLQEDASAETMAVDGATALRAAFIEGHWTAFTHQLEHLIHAYPLYLHDMDGAGATRGQIRWARRLYDQRCAACHRYRNPTAELPAPDLFDWAKTMRPAEFAARMITGIHGTPRISLQNPLDEIQIAALIAYFRQGREEGP
ncbi:hypothetical protein Thpro_020206 [Acidihalobacter prosperus]|uniref:Cytochrome c domain-containing protein n=2 Tax=Acidihalobacter prosperus TaxID=160660 RepID=A0A1A6C7G1_9GAMM|nr:hypothetical protein Thpro_020206 [Acidihalobacter prosperus]